ncbi:hypothetical protein BJ508DRAFT_332206 [Ascobolus immersus RN42]|uniref:Uncharacterized protein n=1 Tax=Ascobolus immersus RN42 TaxID=1160509 RepID=A0A3N4HQQ6_ASCIM|nr:hypothetical protein BJ508DRAFT_332206 [Ascobolus immersus RN42]
MNINEQINNALLLSFESLSKWVQSKLDLHTAAYQAYNRSPTQYYEPRLHSPYLQIKEELYCRKSEWEEDLAFLTFRKGVIDTAENASENERFLIENIFPIVRDAIIQPLQYHDKGYLEYILGTRDACEYAQSDLDRYKCIFETVEESLRLYDAVVLTRLPKLSRLRNEQDIAGVWKEAGKSEGMNVHMQALKVYGLDGTTAWQGFH